MLYLILLAYLAFCILTYINIRVCFYCFPPSVYDEQGYCGYKKWTVLRRIVAICGSCIPICNILIFFTCLVMNTTYFVGQLSKAEFLNKEVTW